MTTVALSYDDIAERLGISVPSARRLVLRRKWHKMLGNSGRAVIQVPLEFLSEREGDGDAGDTTTAVETALATVGEAALATVAPVDVGTDLLARLDGLQTEMIDMARRLGGSEGELRAIREERDHLKLLLDRHANLLEQRSRPWWRRLVVGY
jgi:hypothetical protein